MIEFEVEMKAPCMKLTNTHALRAIVLCHLKKLDLGFSV